MRSVPRLVAPIVSVWVLVVTPAATSPMTAQSAAALPQGAGSSEELLASAFDLRGAKDFQLVRGPERSHLVWKEKRDNSWVALLDGKASEPYDDVAGLILNADAGVFAFMARRGRGWLVVVGGKEGALYDEVGRLTLSKDGRRVAYRAKRRGKWVVVLDGTESDEFDGVSLWSGAQAGIPVFSNDSRRFAHTGKQEDGWHVWLDGTKGPGFDLVTLPTFSPNSARLAYGARRSRTGSFFLVTDGVPGPEFRRGVGAPVFSPDGQRLAYTAMLSLTGSTAMVVDGLVQEAGPSDVFSAPIFGSDGRHVAYVSRQGRDLAVVVDGQVHQTYKYVSTPLFSPDGQHVAYRASSERWVDRPDTAPAGITVEAVDAPRTWRIVLDGVPSQEYGAATLPQFTADNHLYYVAGDHAARTIIEVVGEQPPRVKESTLNLLADRNLKATPNAPGLLPFVGFKLGELLADARMRDTRIVQFPTVGPGGQTAYVLADGGGKFANRNTDFAHRWIVRDGEDGKGYDAEALDGLQFSADGSILAFELHGVRDLEAAKAGRAADKAWSQVVANGAEGAPYDLVIHGSLRFESGNRVTYFAVRDARLFRVTQPLP